MPAGRGYRFGSPERGAGRLCWRCALRHRPVLRRALLTALVVGTALTTINQGDALTASWLASAGTLAPALLWKIPLTYAVPFAVSTYSALAISREG